MLPRFTTVVPAPLVAIVVATLITVIAHLAVPTVGDQGVIGGALPGFTELLVPLNLETLGIILPTALSVAFVGPDGRHLAILLGTAQRSFEGDRHSYMSNGLKLPDGW